MSQHLFKLVLVREHGDELDGDQHSEYELEQAQAVLDPADNLVHSRGARGLPAGGKAAQETHRQCDQTAHQQTLRACPALPPAAEVLAPPLCQPIFLFAHHLLR